LAKVPVMHVSLLRRKIKATAIARIVCKPKKGVQLINTPAANPAEMCPGWASRERILLNVCNYLIYSWGSNFSVKSTVKLGFC
jgi:hypothetical protein